MVNIGFVIVEQPLLPHQQQHAQQQHRRQLHQPQPQLQPQQLRRGPLLRPQGLRPPRKLRSYVLELDNILMKEAALCTTFAPEAITS